MLRLPFFLIVLIFFVNTANSAEFLGNVKEFYVNSSNLALVNLKQGNTDNRPGCSPTNGWDFSFASDTEYGKQWVSMLLASRMSGQEIRVGYTGNPSGTCQVRYVYFPKQS